MHVGTDVLLTESEAIFVSTLQSKSTSRGRDTWVLMEWVFQVFMLSKAIFVIKSRKFLWKSFGNKLCISCGSVYPWNIIVFSTEERDSIIFFVSFGRVPRLSHTDDRSPSDWEEPITYTSLQTLTTFSFEEAWNAKKCNVPFNLRKILGKHAGFAWLSFVFLVGFLCSRIWSWHDYFDKRETTSLYSSLYPTIDLIYTWIKIYGNL